MRAGAYARALFGQDPDAYVPHLSLLYSDAISRKQKEQLAETEQQDLFIGCPCPLAIRLSSFPGCVCSFSMEVHDRSLPFQNDHLCLLLRLSSFHFPLF